MAVLITGGAGYIGSHAVVQLLNQGTEVVVVDNLSNSNLESIKRVKELTGKDFPFYLTDLLNKEALDAVFQAHRFDSVIHFAGLKAVGESVSMPLHYYHNNLTGTLNLCDVMAAHGVKKLVFSSSATVYGLPESNPINESFPLSATNPYGQTKLMIEQILRDLAVADPTWRIVLLRYFNPIGAHESGRIGENPNGIPNNIMPYITQVAVGKLEQLSVFGDDYDTHDGTGVRDFIHVTDLVNGHIKALEYADQHEGIETFNLGTGQGYSVLDLVNTFQEVTGETIQYKMAPRRPGDIGTCFADPAKAEQQLGWKAEKDLRQMCEDAWKWQSSNPDGY